MTPRLKILQMDYPRKVEESWKESCDMLLSSRASGYLKNILQGKVSRRPGDTRRFFGEAYVATQIDHTEGYYGSFQWLTNKAFLTDRPFAPGLTAEFQQAYRSALLKHFPGKLQRLQENARHVKRTSGITPAAPDLWLVEPSGHHRFIEVKLPKDAVGVNQLAGLAVIASSLSHSDEVSVKIVELNPSWQKTFAEFVGQAQENSAAALTATTQQEGSNVGKSTGDPHRLGLERMRIIWTDGDDLISGGGHGIDFFTGPDGDSSELIAVLRGFEWLHGDPESVRVTIRRSDAVVEAELLAEARIIIENYIRHREAIQGRIGPRLHAHING